MVVARRLDLPPPFLVPPRDRRWCGAAVDEGKVAMRDRHPRAKAHGAKGLTTGQCGAPATHEIDGEPMCRRHAGERALQILLGEGTGDESGRSSGDAPSG